MRATFDLTTPVGTVIRAAQRGTVIIEASGRKPFAVMALDDDLVDYLLERNPKFIKECRKIRSEMKRGKYTTLEEVKKMFAKDLRNVRPGGVK